MENRKRATGKCPDCREIPKPDESGRLRCACIRKAWTVRRGERGTDEEHIFLTKAGFQMMTDVQGDVYYVGPFGHIIWLYPEGEWCGDKAPAACTSLEEYVKSLKVVFESIPIRP